MSNFKSTTKRPAIISIEGNIGAGKSTFLAKLEEHLGKDSGWLFLREPVHIWDEICDQNGQTILSKFYENPAKYAFAFQIMAFTTRLHELKRILNENPNCIGIICERSLDADKHIFAKMLHSDGLIDDVMYNIYERYFSEYEGELNIDGMIYVEAEPNICYQRVAKRSRDGENNIELEYLQKCHLFHTNWIRNTTTKLIKLDVNDNIGSYESQVIMRNWLYTAESFLRQFTNMNRNSNIELDLLARY
jgi:deoxyadenosine/deoxycytidine kinase